MSTCDGNWVRSSLTHSVRPFSLRPWVEIHHPLHRRTGHAAAPTILPSPAVPVEEPAGDLGRTRAVEGVCQRPSLKELGAP